MNFKYFICLLLAVQSLASAEENLHRDFNPELVLAKTASWHAVRKLRDNKVSLQFIPVGGAAASGAESKTTYVPPLPTSKLSSARVIRIGQQDYLITVWLEGVHSTALRIYDPKDASGPLIWQKFSVGGVRYVQTAEGLTATVNELQPAGRGMRPVTVKWKVGKEREEK